MGVRIVGMGVTSDIDQIWLHRIASRPDLVITVPDFIFLANQVDDIVRIACRNGPGPPSPQQSFGSSQVARLIVGPEPVQVLSHAAVPG